MKTYLPYLNPISSQQAEMTALLESWANINSSTDNLDGLALMFAAIERAFDPFGDVMEAIPIPPSVRIDSNGIPVETPLGQVFYMQKYPKAPIRILLGGHMDTVYPLSNPFQKAELLDKNTMRGPGVSDMKGGLIVMLKALEALENSPFAGKLGWDVLITPDEEIGSPGSEALWKAAAKNHVLGLLFEPSFPDGSLVSSRKGSANFSVVAKGRAAHAGRDFHSGRSAISAIARFIVAAERLTDKEKGITVNVGHIEGGGPVNIVPELAICRLNIRMIDPVHMHYLQQQLQQIVAAENKIEGISLALYEQTARLPKPFDPSHQALFQELRNCAQAIGYDLQQRPSGGVTDGNILSHEGLTNIDNLGVIGGDIHTSNEYVLLHSLTERATLTAYFLMKLANQEIDLRLFQGVRT